METNPSALDPETPEQRVLLAEEISIIRSVLGPEIPDANILCALSVAGNNPGRAINILLDSPHLLVVSGPVKHDIEIDPQVLREPKVEIKKEEPGFASRKAEILVPEIVVKEGNDEILMPEIRVEEEKGEILAPEISVKTEKSGMDFENYVVSTHSKPQVRKDKCLVEYGEDFLNTTKTHFSPYLNPRPVRSLRPPRESSLQMFHDCLAVEEAERGDFPEEPEWLLVGKTSVIGLSTSRGKNKLVADEIVHFAFPKSDLRQKLGRQWGSTRAAAAPSGIVRFSTKRTGEIGRVPTEWARCLIPLVNSSKVKVRGRCPFPPHELTLMQEIVLQVSFYIHSSIFIADDKSSWRLIVPSQLDSTLHPLPTLFKLLKIKPFKRADFTPEELVSRKCLLNPKEVDYDVREPIVGLPKRRSGGKAYPEQINDEQAISESSLNKLVGSAEAYDLKEDDYDVPQPIVGQPKRRRGGKAYPEQGNDAQAISESSLNKFVGAAESYDLKEAEPPDTLTCELRPYQKEALYWMSELEKGIDVEEAAKTLHPCWEAYKLFDGTSTVYVNVFSGEASTQFPSATQMARGGILADAMGLGKTVMTIALILGKPSRECLDNEDNEMSTKCDLQKARKTSQTDASSTVQGGTLIVCPMALLGQWKDELEAHSQPGAISVFVHYGGDRTTDPEVVAGNDVVLTTYGVLAAAYKSDSGKESIFHQIKWYRVILDEAHTIKSSKTHVAQSAFALVAHCRWCVTGTPLQNNLEDLYSLLCFLHVEPWCNWAWWHKLIQRPYECGDERGLRLVKSILRPLMLRRTKDTKDKEGRPILVLPPAHVKIVECEQSEAERDFYEALFKKSKVRFDQFVAQGKVLHNYASILELLLRLRQCCNHPFLVMSRGDNQQFADLNKLARRFLKGSQQNSTRPTAAYVEEVVDGIRKGEVAECPICLESASDDPVLTPCAHRMCRECLLSSWRTPNGGPCPICRNLLSKADLVTLPSESRFQVDVEKNWKESSKVTKLISCLRSIWKSDPGEKSIVFSQWTAFLDLLEIPLRRKGIGFLRFDGKLCQKQRKKVLEEFGESSDKLVLLMSLKAGGVGLNLTVASNVFLMDPWWNPAVEEQAIMRIHRIGQKRQVRVRRFIVKDTVEERMQQVQARKQRLIAGALTDEQVRSARIEELKMLFR